MTWCSMSSSAQSAGHLPILAIAEGRPYCTSSNPNGPPARNIAGNSCTTPDANVLGMIGRTPERCAESVARQFGRPRRVPIACRKSDGKSLSLQCELLFFHSDDRSSRYLAPVALPPQERHAGMMVGRAQSDGGKAQKPRQLRREANHIG